MVSAGKLPGGLDVVLVRRPDRFGRGGDHTPFLKLGYPAVRFTVGVENYDAQHQDLRTENGRIYGDTVDRMDFAYLAKVTAINVATIRRLASAPAAPASVTIGGALASDTSVKWEPVPGASRYRVHWRRADAQDWQQHTRRRRQRDGAQERARRRSLRRRLGAGRRRLRKPGDLRRPHPALVSRHSQ